MATNPLIALQAKGVDIGGAFKNALLNISNIDRIKQERELQPIRERLLRSRADISEAEVPTDVELANEADRANLQKVAFTAESIVPDLIAGNTERALTTLKRNRDKLISEGKTQEQMAETLEAISLMESGQSAEVLRFSQDAIATNNRLNAPRIARAAIKSFAPVTIVDPVTKEKRLVTPTFDPNTQKAVLSPFDLPEGFEISRETPEERRTADILAKEKEITTTREAKTTTARETAKAKTLGAASAKKAGEAIKQANLLKSNNVNLRGAVAEIELGANTGPLISKLPSFKASTVRLENMQKKLGLDVIGSVTFGALSKGELDLAQKVALPDDLTPPELKQWVFDKIDAQEKLADYLEEQAIFLSRPGNSEADWLELQRSRQGTRQPATQQQPSNVGRFQIRVK